MCIIAWPSIMCNHIHELVGALALRRTYQNSCMLRRVQYLYLAYLRFILTWQYTSYPCGSDKKALQYSFISLYVCTLVVLAFKKNVSKVHWGTHLDNACRSFSNHDLLCVLVPSELTRSSGALMTPQAPVHVAAMFHF